MGEYNTHHMDLLALPHFEVTVRITVAMLLGLLVGAERSHVGKSAGMRTYALVSLGAALFVLISEDVALKYAASFSFDPLRVASQLVVGIGFLGAGVIFVQREVLTGLTTAAGLWVVRNRCAGMVYISPLHMQPFIIAFEALWYMKNIFAQSEIRPNKDR